MLTSMLHALRDTDLDVGARVAMKLALTLDTLGVAPLVGASVRVGIANIASNLTLGYVRTEP